MNKILIKHPKNWGLSENLVRRIAQATLKGWDRVELSLVFVGRQKAKELNQQYRQMNYIPQVLSFPISKEKNADGWIRLGDIVICTEKLKYEAKFQHKSLTDILAFWLSHGVANLL
ncbi:MAG TPA: rRNA maturation RNase YbeY [Candidatus Woesebacteria bacterium]|nr:rRNA maturation RNase YbeY [Candidatus Woesebacteria bacterium]HRS22757.1 rRNA maturation RNase YbeY [Candidatus Woesebacteria bacterium]HRT40154.1 rRNA maturation RNase YbeY [Candidatus Woesebacteria bacterium]